MLELKQVNKKFKNFTLSDVSFQVPEGYITGLVGKNGAGKSSLIRLIMDVLRKDSGSISLDGLDSVKDGTRFRDQVGFVLESADFYIQGKSAEENGNILGNLYSNWNQEMFLSYMDEFEIKKSEQKWNLISQLSTGQFIRFQLAFALAHKPKLLLLDEPTGNLDPVFRMKFLEELQSAIETEELAVLFATHITTDLDKIGDYITVMDQGKILLSESKEELFDRYQTNRISEVIKQIFGQKM
jgi:ABC-2 type transport system ATP-binding protein